MTSSEHGVSKINKYPNSNSLRFQDPEGLGLAGQNPSALRFSITVPGLRSFEELRASLPSWRATMTALRTMIEQQCKLNEANEAKDASNIINMVHDAGSDLETSESDDDSEELVEFWLRGGLRAGSEYGRF